MNDRAAYLLQILEKVGSPLMAAILAAPERKSAPADVLQQDAVRMAELLAKTTQASIEMSQSMDFGMAFSHGDALRVALAALASPLVGSYYRNSGKAPADADIKKMTMALQAVLTFSDNFTPSLETTHRLQNIEAGMPDMDAYQTIVQYVQAFVPVINAINSFPFGQPEQKLIMDVSERLTRKSKDVCESVFGPLPDGPRKWTELAILKGLAQIYAVCHEAETVRLGLNSSDQQASIENSLETIWQQFEIRASMLETLATSIANRTLGTQSGGDPKIQLQTEARPETRTSPLAPAAAPVTAVSPVTPPAQTPPSIFQAPKKEPPAAVPATAVSPAPTTPPSAANPMSMFAKKPDQTTAAAAPNQPQSPSTQPEKPAGNTPMSFFKAPAKKEDE